ncbi:MAG: hypothetical protein A2Z13_10200 [Deltaproteobacteria bacterium RBG_16_64_85]|nr:MAG: hypothetical protein A2Z13_10200 [Deltaproteobacteria bacterium RBG_16_64_85]
MPRGDGTGPMGMGPRTGRAAGTCAGYWTPGNSYPVPGRGFGMGFGHGWRHWFHATGVPDWMRFGGHAPGYPRPDPELEKQGLRNIAETLASELEAIRKRISELETGSAEK